MNSFRLKIVVSLIGLSLISFALGGFNTRSILLDSFENVMVARSADGFVRDVLDYYREHGSWELAGNAEEFYEFRDRRGLPPPPADDADLPSFLATDLAGKVWVVVPPTAKNDSLGDVLPEQRLRNAIPIRDGAEVVGYVTWVGEVLPSEIEDRYLQSLTHTWWLSLLLVAAVAIPAGVFLGNRLAGPINELIRAFSAMGPTTLRQEVAVKSKDELGLLSHSFNQMSADLADFVQVIKSQRETIAESENMLRQGLVNVSHELRTPLYTSLTRAQAMLDGVRALDKAQMKKLADSLNYLSNLVDDLHQLSLADVKALRYDAEAVDLASLVRECIANRETEFQGREFKLDVDIPTELNVHGDSTRLRQIVENLLSNCLRYSDRGAQVCIQLCVIGEFAQLVVSDSGPGVPTASLGALFDRFYRVDESRSRATGGTGLGLSLVKTCAEIHGGDVEAFASDQGGLGICVRIPIDLYSTQG